MLNFIDSYLNQITMYSLTQWCLRVLVGAGLFLSFFDVLPFRPIDLAFSTLVLVIGCWLVNQIFAKTFRVPANVESAYITGLILTLIITPRLNLSSFLFYLSAATLAMAGKYILAYRGKHFFNPAALAVAVTAYTVGYGASWWIGTIYLLPLVVIGGFLITRKIQRFDLVLSFLAVAILGIMVSSPSRSQPLLLLQIILTGSPIIFFSTIMLTEPMTTPPAKWQRIGYAALVGLMFGPAFHIGPIYATPELALLVGNIFSYAASPKAKYLMTLKSKQMVGPDTYDLVFTPNRKLSFRPGQFMEWTLGHKKPDNRGNRRYFTIASSPTENEVHLGIKFYENASSFKKNLFALPEGSQILAGQLAGDFTLPADQGEKLLFIAGGIGVTPFRSILKYLVDRKEKRDIVLFYSNKTANEIAYKDLLDQAKLLGVKIVYNTGTLTAEKIISEAPDLKDRKAYISGPHGMVVAFEKILKDLGVPRSRIKIDFFPGFV